MKHCPECNFTFPDFHRVCDFDGTELVQNPERKSLVNATNSSRASRFRRSLKSPVVWAGLLLVGVLASAFLVAYYDATGQTALVVNNQPTPVSIASAIAASAAPTKPEPLASDTTIKLRPAELSSASLKRQANTRHSVARFNQRTHTSVKPQRSEVVRRTDTEQRKHEKEPRLTAMLKTTWRVVKWPFRF